MSLIVKMHLLDSSQLEDSILRSPTGHFSISLDLDCHLDLRINSNQFDVNPLLFVYPILHHRPAMHPISTSFVPCSNRCHLCVNVDRLMLTKANTRNRKDSLSYNGPLGI